MWILAHGAGVDEMLILLIPVALYFVFRLVRGKPPEDDRPPPEEHPPSR